MDFGNESSTDGLTLHHHLLCLHGRSTMYFHCVFEVSACVTSIGEDRKRGSRRPACERSEFRQFKLDCISIFVKTLDMKAVNTKVDET